MKRTLITLIPLALAQSGAGAQIYTFNVESTITWALIDGNPYAMSPAFQGVEVGDVMSFHFEYDINTLPSSGSVDTRATYTIYGTNSWVQIGSNRVDFDHIRIWAGSQDVGFDDLHFLGMSPDLDFGAGVSFASDEPTTGVLPTSFDLDSMNVRQFGYADSYSNIYPIPLVGATIESAAITPAPGPFAGMLVLGICAVRRAR